MQVNMSLEMINVVAAILDKTPPDQLLAVAGSDGHDYEVDGTDAQEFFSELRKEARALYKQ